MTLSRTKLNVELVTYKMLMTHLSRHSKFLYLFKWPLQAPYIYVPYMCFAYALSVVMGYTHTPVQISDSYFSMQCKEVMST